MPTKPVRYTTSMVAHVQEPMCGKPMQPHTITVLRTEVASRDRRRAGVAGCSTRKELEELQLRRLYLGVMSSTRLGATATPTPRHTHAIKEHHRRPLQVLTPAAWATPRRCGGWHGCRTRAIFATRCRVAARACASTSAGTPRTQLAQLLNQGADLRLQVCHVERCRQHSVATGR